MYIMIGYIVYIVLFDIACEVHDFLTKKEKKGKPFLNNLAVRLNGIELWSYM